MTPPQTRKEFMRTIYIVDDEPSILEVYQDSIREQIDDVLVKTFPCAQACIEAIESNGAPTLVITDLKMPDLNGYMLAKKILTIDAGIPVLLNTALSEIATKESGIGIGFRKIIDKGSPISDFIRDIKKYLDEVNEDIPNYLRIESESLLRLKNAPFCIYVKLNDEKFVSLIKAGDPVPQEKIKDYVAKGITRYYIQLEDYKATEDSLYIPFRTSIFQAGQTLDFNAFIRANGGIKKLLHKDIKIVDGHLELLKKHSFKTLLYDNADEKSYLNYLDKIIDSVLDEKHRNFDEEKKIVVDYSDGKMKHQATSPVGPNLNEVLRVSDIMMKFCSKHRNQNLYRISLNFNDNTIHHHSIRVALISIAIINQILIWRKNEKNKNMVLPFEKTIHDGKEVRSMIIIAAMTHDLWCKSLPKEYDSVLKAKEMIDKKREIPAKVSELVLQHKERLDGSGGPNKIVKRQMSIYSQLFALVNYFDELIYQGNSTTDAIIDIQMNQNQFNQHLVSILKAVVESK